MLLSYDHSDIETYKPFQTHRNVLTNYIPLLEFTYVHIH